MSLGLFSKMLANQPSNSPLNSQRWLKIGNMSMFIIKTFSASDSVSLDSDTLSNSLVFDSNGNIKGSTLGTFMNPLVSSSIQTTQTIGYYKDNNLGYRTTSNVVFTANLKYILYKDSTSTWYLLYNPLHRQSFKNFYQSIPQGSFLSSGFPVTNDDSSGLNLQAVFGDYCSAFIDTTLNNKPFLDPTCGCIKSLTTCEQNALLGGVNSVFPDSSSSVLGKIGNSCVCINDGCSYSGTSASDSFIGTPHHSTSDDGDFVGLANDCSNPTYITNCQEIIHSASSTDIQNSKLIQNCGAPTPPSDTSGPSDPPSPPSPPSDPSSGPSSGPSDPPSPPSPPSSQSNIGLIIGIISGVIVLISILIFILLKK